MKQLLLLALLLGLSINTFSQSGTFGVRGGYNISNLDFEGEPIMENKHRNSFYIGVFAEYSLGKAVAIVPELQFSAEGANDEKLHLDYIQAPILFKFNLGKKMRFGLGPQAGYKIPKYNDGIRDMAFSGVGSLEYKLNYALFVDLRYTYGMSDILETEFNNSAKNTNIQIGVGYQF